MRPNIVTLKQIKEFIKNSKLQHFYSIAKFNSNRNFKDRPMPACPRRLWNQNHRRPSSNRENEDANARQKPREAETNQAPSTSQTSSFLESPPPLQRSQVIRGSKFVEIWNCNFKKNAILKTLPQTNLPPALKRYQYRKKRLEIGETAVLFVAWCVRLPIV